MFARQRTCGIVLLYHRVVSLTSDPQLLAVTPAHFDQHLAILREHGATPMSLAAMVTAASEHRLPRRAVAVTFDDGYADNLTVAEPILMRHDVTATMFVTTDYVGADREFWWDELERLLLADDGRAVRWDVEQESDPAGGCAEYRRACVELRGVSDDERRGTIAAMARRVGNPGSGRATHYAVSRESLAQAADRGVISVGAHSRSHPALAARPHAEQREEIEGSRNTLREILGREPVGFSYPFGGRDDYTADTVSMVRAAGFPFACANAPGLVDRSADPFRLPRLLVRSWDADHFMKRLRACGW